MQRKCTNHSANCSSNPKSVLSLLSLALCYDLGNLTLKANLFVYCARPETSTIC